MEFPDLGQQCSFSACRRLDFLPVKCDCCKSVYCVDHLSYLSHACPAEHLRDVQVPVCPLCDRPVPVDRGEVPDLKVSRHIDNDCQSDPAKVKRRAYTNRCSRRKCKTKELVPVTCDTCRKNFCLKHRHEQDHSCSGPPVGGEPSAAARAAMARASKAETSAAKPNPFSSLFTSSSSSSSRGAAADAGLPRPAAAATVASRARVQAGLSDDEALARALQASMTTASEHTTADDGAERSQAQTESAASPANQEEQDRMLALALQQSEQEAAAAAAARSGQQQHRTTTAGNGNKSKYSTAIRHILAAAKR